MSNWIERTGTGEKWYLYQWKVWIICYVSIGKKNSVIHGKIFKIYPEKCSVEMI